MSLVISFFYFISTLCVMDTARILGVFPTPSISHQVVFRVLTEELVKRGHEVVVITTDPVYVKGQAPRNLTEIDVHDISYDFLHGIMSSDLGADYNHRKNVFHTLLQEFTRIIEVQVKSEPVQKLIQEKRDFDVLLIESFIKPALVFSNIFKAPVILVSSFGLVVQDLEVVGAQTHPLLYPDHFNHGTHNLSFWEKLKEYYFYFQRMYLQKSFDRLDDELIQRLFGSSMPTMNELSENVDMLFLNVHPIWVDNRPLPPGVIFMGGIHQKPAKELPRDLKSYLDSSQNGVVYVSFGTNVHPYMFPPERLKIFTDALSELQYDILFKWNDDVLPGMSKNIKISKWLPQSDLLRHPNVKAFVMQGGLQSTDEAITAGVPLVAVPMLGDQWYNAQKYVQLKIGIKLDFPTVTKTQLKEAIETVISDNSYRENILKLRDRMNDQPQPPLERAIWWIEYVIRHGGARHLRAPAANMSWAKYYELELVFIVLTCALISTIVFIFTAISLWRYVSRFDSRNVKVKKS